jgi:hypothetical protein
MNAITKKTLITLAFLLPSSLFPWSFSGMISDATSSVSSYFNKNETESSSKEYAIGLHTPLKLTNHSGNVKVTTWNKPALMVEAVKHGSEEDLKYTSFAVTVHDDHVTITTETHANHKPATIDYTLIIPRSAALTVRTESGNISLYDSHANIDLQTLDGSIKIEQATKSIRAQAQHGHVTIEQQELHRDGSIFVEADRDISLVIPENANALLNVHAPHGKITSDVYVTIDPITTKLDKDAYKRLQHTIKGTMGAGGAPITLESMHGSITILGT